MMALEEALLKMKPLKSHETGEHWHELIYFNKKVKKKTKKNKLTLVTAFILMLQIEHFLAFFHLLMHQH